MSWSSLYDASSRVFLRIRRAKILIHFSHNRITVWNLGCKNAPDSHESCSNITTWQRCITDPIWLLRQRLKHHTAWAVKFIFHNMLQRNPATARSQSLMMAEFQWADLPLKICCQKMQFGFELFGLCLEQEGSLAAPAARRSEEWNPFWRLCPPLRYQLPPSTSSRARLWVLDSPFLFVLKTEDCTDTWNLKIKHVW